MNNKEEMDTKITTISLKKATKDRLERHGRFNETFDDILNRLMEEYGRF